MQSEAEVRRRLHKLLSLYFLFEDECKESEYIKIAIRELLWVLEEEELENHLLRKQKSYSEKEE